MPENPRLPDDITAVLDRCVGEMRSRVVKELERAESDEDRLEVLARFRREIGSVRDKVTGRARIGISGKWVLIASLLSAIGGGAVAGAVFSGDKQPTSTADSVAKAGEAECPPCADAGGPPKPEKSDAESAAQGGRDASSNAARLKAAADAKELVDKKHELKAIIEMLRNNKDEWGDPLTNVSRKELEEAKRALEMRIKELASLVGTPEVPPTDNDGTKAEAETLDAAVKSDADAGVATPDTGVAAPDADEPAKPNLYPSVTPGTGKVHDDDVEYE